MRFKPTIVVIAIIAAITVVTALGQEVQLFNITPQPLSYYFMGVRVVNEKGEADNQKFFLGPLPQEGDVVEMVYVGSSAEGEMHLQLRTKK